MSKLGQLIEKTMIHIQLYGFSYAKLTSKKKLWLDLRVLLGCMENIRVESIKIIKLLKKDPAKRFQGMTMSNAIAHV